MTRLFIALTERRRRRVSHRNTCHEENKYPQHRAFFHFKVPLSSRLNHQQLKQARRLTRITAEIENYSRVISAIEKERERDRRADRIDESRKQTCECIRVQRSRRYSETENSCYSRWYGSAYDVDDSSRFVANRRQMSISAV